MSGQQQARKQQTHSAEVRQVYERVLAGASVRSRYIEVAGDRVHLLEKSVGPPVVLLHGTGNSAGFFLPLLNELEGVRAMAIDLPGVGLSDPIDLPRKRYRETAVAWLDSLLDALELDAAALLGHSGGGRWALWYAMAHPGRVKRLVLIGVPGVPKTRCPLPIRLIAIPGMGELLSRLVPPSPKSVLRFASFVGEKATLAAHPDLVDLMVATGRDPIAAASARAEIRVLVSPFALAVAFWVPASFPRATRRAAPAGNAHAGGMGRTRPARQRFGRPGSDQAHPARATEGAAHRPRAMARAACADCRDGRGLRAVTG